MHRCRNRRRSAGWAGVTEQQLEPQWSLTQNVHLHLSRWRRRPPPKEDTSGSSHKVVAKRGLTWAQHCPLSKDSSVPDAPPKRSRHVESEVFKTEEQRSGAGVVGLGGHIVCGTCSSNNTLEEVCVPVSGNENSVHQHEPVGAVDGNALVPTECPVNQIRSDGRSSSETEAIADAYCNVPSEDERTVCGIAGKWDGSVCTSGTGITDVDSVENSIQDCNTSFLDSAECGKSALDDTESANSLFVDDSNQEDCILSLVEAQGWSDSAECDGSAFVDTEIANSFVVEDGSQEDCTISLDEAQGWCERDRSDSKIADLLLAEYISQENSVTSLESLAENEEVICSSWSWFSKLPALSWLSKKEVDANAKSRVETLETVVATGWESLSLDLQDIILNGLSLEDACRFKAVSKTCKEHIESASFADSRAAIFSGEGSFTAMSFYILNKAWQCMGFDLQSNRWRRLPTFSFLPSPDIELFKEYSVSGAGGLMCANVSKSSRQEKLIVFNLLTKKKVELPPLKHRRNPVLLYLLVDSATNSYKVIVAGSSSGGDGLLSKRMEVFDSLTSEWEVKCDIPTPEFGLNEHQTGVCVDGILYFVAFLEGECRKGVLAYEVLSGAWLENRTCPVPFSSYSNNLQLVESSGKVYLFSEQEQERGNRVDHCIDVLEFSASDVSMKCQLKNVIRVAHSGGRGLQVYPEFTCIPHRDGKLCIFNTIKREGLVYNILDGKQSEILPPPPANQMGDNFFSLNALSFKFQPSFISDTLLQVNRSAPT